MTEDQHVRLDKWLWAARFYKSRGLAADEIAKGRVSVNGQPAKASREPKLGELVQLRQGTVLRTVSVLALSPLRGPASQAQTMYAETADSMAARLKAAETRRQGVEPADAQPQGRPTKRNQRVLASWQRWSASADDLPEA